MGGIAELRARAQRRTSNVYDTLFTRRVSIYVTAALHKLGVGPNAVSAANLPVGLCACGLLAVGEGPWLLAGVGLVHAYAVLDSVDGELARLTRRFSLQGLFLEDLSAFAMINGFWLAVAAYLWRTSGALWPAAVAIAMCAFLRNAPAVARRALIKSVQTRRPPKDVPVKGAGAGNGRGLRRFLQEHVLHSTNMWVLLTSLMLAEEYGGLGDLRLVMIGFVLFALANAAKELYAIVLFGLTDALDRELLVLYRAASAVPDEPVSGADLAAEPKLG